MATKPTRPRHDCPICGEKSIAMRSYQPHLSTHLVSELVEVAMWILQPENKNRVPKELRGMALTASITTGTVTAALLEAQRIDEAYADERWPSSAGKD